MQFIYTKPLKYQFRLNIFDGDKNCCDLDFRSLRPHVKTTARTRGDVSGDSYREGMDNLPSANNRAVDGEERGRRRRKRGGRKAWRKQKMQ